METKLRKYKDAIHGIEVMAISEKAAVAEIAKQCRDQNIEVPTSDKVALVK